MCGIVGILRFDDERVCPAGLDRMRDVLAHRGPDGVGRWISADGRVGFGHRRLKIIDLSAAADQPMSNEDDTLWLSFNGEIYNHVEIRRELEAMGGHRWKTDHSDTEVILHSFEQWGIDCLDRFRGAFAISLWDERKRELWLARDRIGVKPLYYSKRSGRLAFASEIKALLEDPDEPRQVDEESLYHYLSFLTTPAPRTLFAGIRKLAGGTWLRVNADGDVTERRYWDVLDHAEALTGISDEDAARMVLDELRESVRLRTRSDVPVGIFLSGGLDSSTNAALFSECEGAVKTFSIGYTGEHDAYPNELAFARRAAEHVGAEHYERCLSMDDLLEFLPTMVWLQDEPISDPVCVPVYYVSELARQHGVSVCQVGEGADELFWGYPVWRTMRTLQRWSDAPGAGPAKAAAAAMLGVAGKGDGFRAEWLRRGRAGQPVFWGGAEAFTDAQKRTLLSPRVLARLGDLTSWDAIAPIRDRFEAGAWSTDALSWMTYLDLNLRLPELLLMRVDKMSMGVSLEGRVPFLDHRLAELAMSLPEATKTRNGELKHVLKHAVRGLIPDDIIDRPKQGFGVPVHDWFLHRLGERAREELRAFCAETDFFDANAMMRLLEQPKRSEQVWYLLNFALWWKRFVQ